MISEWKYHDEASHRLQLSFAEEIHKRVERLENIMKPSFLQEDDQRLEGTGSARELSSRVETLAAEVADIGNRLERIECLLMCSDLSQIRKIDNLLRQLKRDVNEQIVDTKTDKIINKYGASIDPLEGDLPQPLHCYADQTASIDGVLKVWPSYDLSQEELVASTSNLEPEPENDFVPLCDKRDLKTVLPSTQHSMEPDVKEPMANDMQAQPKQMTPGVNQQVLSSVNSIEQIASRSPVRFWRDDQESSETGLAIVGASLQQHSAGLTFDAKEPLVNEKRAPRKQSRSRGWNLAAEAASSGKRIVPKK